MSLSEDAITSPEDDITWDYTYNADGLRTTRTSSSKYYSYVYNGDKLAYMTAGDKHMYFAYDANGTPMSIVYSGTVYYYVTNVQGDVIALVDSTGAEVVSYSYDAWGNPLSMDGDLKETLGKDNPLRYRSYVYDTETKLYYLQSRYYNPEIGRFINADIQLNTSLGIRGINTISYCLNNPVNMVDYSGRKPGDLFPTMDDAAIDAAKHIGPISFENNWEYSTAFYMVETVIYKLRFIEKTVTYNGTTHTVMYPLYYETIEYKYTYVPESTDRDPISVYVPQVPSPYKRIGGFHTHPMGSWRGITKFSDGDIDWVKNQDIPLYLLGPNGYLLKCDPLNGISVVESGLPQTTGEPWLEYLEKYAGS